MFKISFNEITRGFVVVLLSIRVCKKLNTDELHSYFSLSWDQANGKQTIELSNVYCCTKIEHVSKCPNQNQRCSFIFSISSRWHRSARKGPSLSNLPNVALKTVQVFAWLNTDRSRPWRVECRSLPFLSPLSFR